MMQPTIIIPGDRFGYLTVSIRGESKHGQARWICVCECSKELLVYASGLRSGTAKSCGCRRITRRTHGMRNTPEYVVWQGMRARCLSPANKDFQTYGGKGITVCERWNKFENFWEDMGPRPSAKHSIDRIDNERNYEKENCRWATPLEQTHNRRSTRIVTLNGEAVTMAEAAKRHGIPYEKLWARLNRGWPLEKALEIAS